jgi:effector-binding domain-containing protein
MKVERIEKAIGPVLEVEEMLPMWKMPKTLAVDYAELSAEIKAQKLDPTGVPFARYVDIDWQAQLEKGVLITLVETFSRNWHFHAGMPVSDLGYVDSGRVKPEIIPKQEYLKAIHRGPYHKVGKTYQAMVEFAKREGLSLAQESFEFYLNDPFEVDKEVLETEVLIPLASV